MKFARLPWRVSDLSIRFTWPPQRNSLKIDIEIEWLSIRFAWPPQWDSMKFGKVSIEMEWFSIRFAWPPLLDSRGLMRFLLRLSGVVVHRLAWPPQWDSMNMDEVCVEIE